MTSQKKNNKKINKNKKRKEKQNKEKKEFNRKKTRGHIAQLNRNGCFDCC